VCLTSQFTPTYQCHTCLMRKQSHIVGRKRWTPAWPLTLTAPAIFCLTWQTAGVALTARHQRHAGDTGSQGAGGDGPWESHSR
jgi:hypothetical protein